MADPFFSRDLLAKHFGGDHRMIAEFEANAEAVKSNTITVAETAALKDATVIVLSANGEFTNERVLTVDDGLLVEVAEGTVTISIDPAKVAVVEGNPVTFTAANASELAVPATGTLISSTVVTTLGDFANDAAAAAGGVPLTGLYRNGSVLMVRVV